MTQKSATPRRAQKLTVPKELAGSLIAEHLSACVGKNQRVTIKQLYLPYTTSHSKFFDPGIQNGGKSWYFRCFMSRLSGVGKQRTPHCKPVYKVVIESLGATSDLPVVTLSKT